jgi:hypothetical protein
METKYPDGHGHVLIVHDFYGGFREDISPKGVNAFGRSVPLVKTDSRPDNQAVGVIVQQRGRRVLRLKGQEPAHTHKLSNRVQLDAYGRVKVKGAVELLRKVDKVLYFVMQGSQPRHELRLNLVL